MSAINKTIKVDELYLDPYNPRLPSYLRGADQDQIIKYMLLEASTIELMQAIGENGYFEGEQLLVVQDEHGKYKVVEGNRRLTAVLLLRDPSLAPVQQSRVQRVFDEADHKLEEFSKLPCAIFDNEDIIHRYLGYRHITGVQPWNLRQRAEYLSTLRKEIYPSLPLDDACRELAKMIGSRRDYVKRIVVGYGIYWHIKEEDFFSIKDLDEDTFYFNYIADSLNKDAISGFIGVDLNSEEPLESLKLKNLKLLTRWFFEKYGENQTRLKGRSQDLKMLDAILENEFAKKAFIKESMPLADAYELTADMEELFRGAIIKAINELELADSLTHKIEDHYPGIEDDLKQIGRLSRKIRISLEEFYDDEAEDDDD